MGTGTTRSDRARHKRTCYLYYFTPPKADRLAYIRMEFPRFLHSVILIPCRVVRRARSITLRLLGYQPTADRLFSAWRTIERMGFT